MRKFLQGLNSAGFLIAAILLATPLTATPAPASAKNSAPSQQEFLAQLAAPPSAQACHTFTEYYTYYSDASKTQEVGWCEYDCYCISYCDGQKTQYWNHAIWWGCL